MVILGLTGALLSVLVGAPALAQTGEPLPPNPRQVPAPLPHRYWHFLIYLDYLDQLAVRRQLVGKDGSVVRNLLQRQLDFTDEQFALVRSTAQRLQTELKTLDAQAMAIIKAERAANPPQPGVRPTWRPVPPELHALQQQHEDLIESEVTNLKSALGPELAARLDAFLQSPAAPKVTAQRLHTPLSREELRQHILQTIQREKEQEAQQ
jgi:hypothetical protein